MDGFIRSEASAHQAHLMRKGGNSPFLLQVARNDDDESETTQAPRSDFQRWFGPQYKGWISYEERPPSGKMTQFFPIRGLSLLLLPAISFLSARCASRGIILTFGEEMSLCKNHQMVSLL